MSIQTSFNITQSQVTATVTDNATNFKTFRVERRNIRSDILVYEENEAISEKKEDNDAAANNSDQ